MRATRANKIRIALQLAVKKEFAAEAAVRTHAPSGTRNGTIRRTFARAIIAIMIAIALIPTVRMQPAKTVPAARNCIFTKTLVWTPYYGSGYLSAFSPAVS